MKTEYKLELRKTIEPIKQSRWFYLASALATLVWLFIIPDLTFVFWIIGFMVGLPIILQIVLHVNYYLHDKHIILEIDYGNRIISYSKLTQKIEIPFDTITLMKRFQGRRYPRSLDVYLLPSSFYHYTVIETSDHKKIKFSDFVKDEISIHDIKKKKIVVPFLNLILE